MAFFFSPGFKQKGFPLKTPFQQTQNGRIMVFEKLNCNMQGFDKSNPYNLKPLQSQTAVAKDFSPSNCKDIYQSILTQTGRINIPSNEVKGSPISDDGGDTSIYIPQ